MPLQSPKMQFVLDANGDPMITEFKRVMTAILKVATAMEKTQRQTRSASNEFNKFKGVGDRVGGEFEKMRNGINQSTVASRGNLNALRMEINRLPIEAKAAARDTTNELNRFMKQQAMNNKEAIRSYKEMARVIGSGVQRSFVDARKESDRAARAIREKWSRLTGVFLGVGGSIAILHSAFYGLRRLFRDIIDTTVNFEESMNRVRAVTAATATEFEFLNNQAKQLGSTTRFTATQVAQGQGFLGQAGFDSFEVLEATPAVLRLSSAGMLEMARAGDILTNIMGGFQLATSEAARAADVLAAAATSSNTSIEQLGEGLKFAAPVANELGVSLERTTALMGILGNQGLQATVAGVGLRQVMLSLIGPTAGAQVIFDKYNISLKNYNGELRQVIDIIDDLKAAGAAADEFAKIFDRRGATIALAISNYTDEVRELTKALELSHGAAERMADIMESRLPGSVKKFESAWEGLKLAFRETALFEALVEAPMGALTQIFRGLTPDLEDVAEQFNTINRSFDDFTNQIKKEEGYLQILLKRPDAETKRGQQLIMTQDKLIAKLRETRQLYGTERGLEIALTKVEEKIKSIGEEIERQSKLEPYKFGVTSDLPLESETLQRLERERALLEIQFDALFGKHFKMKTERELAEALKNASKNAFEFDTSGLEAAALWAERIAHEARMKFVQGWTEDYQNWLNPAFDQSGLDAGARFSQAYIDGVRMELERGNQQAVRDDLQNWLAGPAFDQSGLDASARFLDQQRYQNTLAFAKEARDEFAKWNQMKDPSEWVIALKDNFKELGKEVSRSLRGMIQNGVEFNEILKRMALNLSLAFVERGLGEGGFIRKLITGRASGGPVSAGQPYIVGEKGPELIVPDYSGYVVPNHKMGGGEVKVETNITVNGNMDDAQIERITNEIATKVNRTRNRAQFMREARA